MIISRTVVIFLITGLLLSLSGCASLDVTSRKTLAPVTEKQNVTLGIQAGGDRLQQTLTDPESSLVKSASGQLFDKVTLLPKESKFMQPQEIKAAYGVDYILSLGISDISVSADLNPLWFAAFPILFFKVYAPIVTFQPGIELDFTLRDAGNGAVLLQKQVIESGVDHYSPSNPGPKVRKLITLTINNALVSVLRDAQQGIAAARKGKAQP